MRFVALFDSFFGGIDWNFLWLIEFFFHDFSLTQLDNWGRRLMVCALKWSYKSCGTDKYLWYWLEFEDGCNSFFLYIVWIWVQFAFLVSEACKSWIWNQSSISIYKRKTNYIGLLKWKDYNLSRFCEFLD